MSAAIVGDKTTINKKQRKKFKKPQKDILKCRSTKKHEVIFR